MLNYWEFIKENNNQSVYHIVDYEKLKYLINEKYLSPYRASNGNTISTTRNKMMNGYLGDSPLSMFKLELNANKIRQNYKITPYSFRSANGQRFKEYEEMILLKIDKRLSIKYVDKLIIIKKRVEDLRKSITGETGFFFTDEDRNRREKIPHMMKYIVENSPFPIYVQDGNVIKKDDEYIQSLINTKLEHIEIKYNVWYRASLKGEKKFSHIDTLIDTNGKKYENFVIGHYFDIDNDQLLNKKELNLNLKTKIVDDVEYIPYIIKFKKVNKDNSLSKKGQWKLADISSLKGSKQFINLF